MFGIIAKGILVLKSSVFYFQVIDSHQCNNSFGWQLASQLNNKSPMLHLVQYATVIHRVYNSQRYWLSGPGTREKYVTPPPPPPFCNLHFVLSKLQKSEYILFHIPCLYPDTFSCLPGYPLYFPELQAETRPLKWQPSWFSSSPLLFPTWPPISLSHHKNRLI